MTTIELFPVDIHNQKTIQQGHPPGWTNRAGGAYDLVVLGGGPAGLVAALTAAAGGDRGALTGQRVAGGGGRAPGREGGAAADRGHLRQFWLHAKQGAHWLRSRDPRCGPRGRVRLSARRPPPGGVRSGRGARGR